MAHRNINPNPKRSLSQKKRILLALQAGERLTPLDAIKRGFGTKLATRVSELINEDGHDEIKKQKVWVSVGDEGEQTEVMSYFIDEPKLEMTL